MPSRRKHTKNRHGCLQCKAAHVKCDQGNPSCGLCARKGKPCSYTKQFARGSALTDNIEAVVKNVSNQGVSSPPISTEVQLAKPQPPSCHIPAQSSDCPSIQYEDLELLHHYVLSTYTTFADEQDLQLMWRTTVPQIAFRFPVLMHSILGVSALHLAHLRASRKVACISSAVRHHDSALSALRNGLNHITPSNVPALYASSALIIVYVFAFPLASQSGLGTPIIYDPVQEVLNVFSLLHGMSIFTRNWSWLEASEISLLFKKVDLTVDSRMPPEALASFSRLRSYIEVIETSDVSLSKKQTYLTTITSLEQLMKSVYAPNSNRGIILSWPYMIDLDYEKLLDGREPIALIILAHYAVMLDTFKKYWWLRGWGKQLILNAERCIRNDERWKELIAWPLDMIVATS